MLFNSVSFLIFFPIVVLGYFAIPDKFKKHWLLAVSYYFYMSWQPVYALLILFSTVTTYYCAVLIDKADNPKKRKTKSGIKRFINGWLAREQDQGSFVNISDKKAQIDEWSRQ